MVSVKVKRKEKMDLMDIVEYIQSNVPKKIKKENINDTFNDKGELIKREYQCESKKGEIHTFITELENNNTYISYEVLYTTEENDVLDINSLLD